MEMLNSGLGKAEDLKAYVLDDSAVTGGGHGIVLSMEIARTLQQEGRGGIVIAACSSNAEILSNMRGRIPFTLADLNQNSIEFWYKHTEIFKMIAWLGSCFKEDKLITRVEWLTSVSENTRYDTFGTGTDTERKIRFLSDDLNKSLKGAFLKISMPDFFRKLREGRYADEVLKEMLSLGKKGKEQ